MIELRVLLAGLVLLPLLVRLQLWRELRQNLLPLFLVGAINSALPFLLLAFASVSLPAGLTSILNATAPLFGLVVAVSWLKERLTTNRLLGFALGLTGVVILVGWTTTITPTFLLAASAGLLAALMYAIAAPYTKRHLAGVSALVIATGSQLSAAIFILPFMPFTIPATVLALNIIFSVIALAIISTSLAYILYFRLIRNIGSTKALSVTYLIPLFAMLWGALFLQESVTIAMVLGCSLVLLGTAIANDLIGMHNRSPRKTSERQ